MKKAKRTDNLCFEKIIDLGNKARFYYSIDGRVQSFYISFNPALVTIDQDSRYLVLSHIGLAYLIDIASICLPRCITIKTINLAADQIEFWQWVYYNIALERAYEEKLPLSFLRPTWRANQGKKTSFNFRKKQLTRVTIAMSGGKESLTALKIYKEYPDLSLFFVDYLDKGSFQLRRVYQDLSRKFKAYKIDTNISYSGGLMDRYNCDSYSLHVIGHVIFNALLYSDKIDYLLVGNEYSANFGNADYLGEKVNHQFDKGIEFAKRINKYIQKHFNGVLVYTSPFFGLYEYKIAELFFADQDYLNIWTSCNYATKKNNFCCRCPKCAFIYIISLAHTSRAVLNKYFPKNPLFNLKLCRELISLTSDKPTDCVGEKKECWLALKKIIEQKKIGKTPVTEYFTNEILPKISQDLLKIERDLQTEHTAYKYLLIKLSTLLRKRING